MLFAWWHQHIGSSHDARRRHINLRCPVDRAVARECSTCFAHHPRIVAPDFAHDPRDMSMHTRIPRNCSMHDSFDDLRRRQQPDNRRDDAGSLPSATFCLGSVPFQCRRAQHHRVHKRPMTLPQQHADRSAHRITNHRRRRHANLAQYRRCIVSTVLKLESFGRSQPAPVPTVVKHDERILLRELLVCGEEVDVSRSGPTVEQKQCRCTRVGVNETTNEELSPSCNRDEFRWGKPRQLVVCVAPLQEHFPHSPITSS